MSKAIKTKRIITVTAAAVLVTATGIAGGLCLRNRHKAAASLNIGSSETTQTATQTTQAETKAETRAEYTVSGQIIEAAIKALNTYFFDSNNEMDIFSAYVTDINKDGIPEVFGSNGPEKFAVSYNAERGLLIEDSFYNSFGDKFYFDFDNRGFVVREDGHNQGTYDWHSATKYSVRKDGFKQIGQIKGDLHTVDFNYEDEAALEEYRLKSLADFDKKFTKFTKGLNLVDYDDVAVTQNIDEYLHAELAI